MYVLPYTVNPWLKNISEELLYDSLSCNQRNDEAGACGSEFKVILGTPNAIVAGEKDASYLTRIFCKNLFPSKLFQRGFVGENIIFLYHMNQSSGCSTIAIFFSTNNLTNNKILMKRSNCHNSLV